MELLLILPFPVRARGIKISDLILENIEIILNFKGVLTGLFSLIELVGSFVIKTALAVGILHRAIHLTARVVFSAKQLVSLVEPILILVEANGTFQNGWLSRDAFWSTGSSGPNSMIESLSFLIGTIGTKVGDIIITIFLRDGREIGITPRILLNGRRCLHGTHGIFLGVKEIVTVNGNVIAVQFSIIEAGENLRRIIGAGRKNANGFFEVIQGIVNSCKRTILSAIN